MHIELAQANGAMRTGGRFATGRLSAVVSHGGRSNRMRPSTGTARIKRSPASGRLAAERYKAFRRLGESEPIFKQRRNAVRETRLMDTRKTAYVPVETVETGETPYNRWLTATMRRAARWGDVRGEIRNCAGGTRLSRVIGKSRELHDRLLFFPQRIEQCMTDSKIVPDQFARGQRHPLGKRNIGKPVAFEDFQIP